MKPHDSQSHDDLSKSSASNVSDDGVVDLRAGEVNTTNEADRNADAEFAQSFPWLGDIDDAERTNVEADLKAIWQCGAPTDLLDVLLQLLSGAVNQLDDVAAATRHLSQFVCQSRSPTSLLALFERDLDTLPSLLQVFATSESLAERLIADPESFDLLRASDGLPAERSFLVDELVAGLRSLTSTPRAAVALRKFVSRETIRIAYGEFVRDLSPEKVGRQLSHVVDAVLEAALDFVVRQHQSNCPTRIDGTKPSFAILGFGSLGGEELGYSQPLKLLFLCDQIDRKNTSHVGYYNAVVSDLIKLISTEDGDEHGYRVDHSCRPSTTTKRQYNDEIVFGLDEAAQLYEQSTRLWRRMEFTKARVVAGSEFLGGQLIDRLQDWTYRPFLSRTDLRDVHVVRQKLIRRAELAEGDWAEPVDDDILRDPGGRQDLELTIQFLQLLHGGDLPDVRHRNTLDAIFALEQSGCLAHREATLLAENYARLCRLQHQLSIMFGLGNSRLPDDETLRRRVAWRLGIRDDEQKVGDLDRFLGMLGETFEINRKIINHLMVDTPDGDHPADANQAVDQEAADIDANIETELMLDPDPADEVVKAVMNRHGLSDAGRAMDAFIELRTESVPFLPSRRCRHFLASLAPALLRELSQTPDPQPPLTQLVAVTDSIGAKASLWELMTVNPPTLRLMVRLCAATPYLAQILIQNPGMIDELIDSLLMNRLPSAERLDGQSIELVRGAMDLSQILAGFKNSAHLMIGVREILGKETIEATHTALANTAESVIRRVIEHEQERLAQRWGDPTDADGNAAELIAVACGKFGGQEPNYHSDLDLIFLYSADGQTTRRVGGPRSTTSNQYFFNELAQAVTAAIGSSDNGAQLYELDGRLRPTGNDGVLAVSTEAFFQRFHINAAPLWQQLALCKARAISGSRRTRRWFGAEVLRSLKKQRWSSGIPSQVETLRKRMQQTAAPENLKRGEGGTAYVELIASLKMLRYLSDSAPVVLPQLPTGTTAAISYLEKNEQIAPDVALQLITSYRTLRGVEAALRLMNAPERHCLPTDEGMLKNLAYLTGDADAHEVQVRCQQARLNNQRLIDRILSEI